MTEPTQNKGLRRIRNAFFNSLNGLRSCIRTEEAFRQEVVLALIFIPVGLIAGETAIERMLLAGSLIIVLVVELLNTAIERTIDRISFEKHDLSRDAKDMGSAAVLLSFVLCVMTWAGVLFFR